MPQVPPSDIEDIPGKDRAKVKKLLEEKSIMGYTFSYKRLLAEVSKYMGKEEAARTIQSCVAAFNEKEKKAIEDDIKAQVADVYMTNNITSLRNPDPFGRLVDYLLFNSTATSFSKTRALEICHKFGIKVDTLTKLFEEATTRTPYTSFQARAVKETED